MNGKILLDTNAVIYALNGGLTLPKANYCISIITEMELSKIIDLDILSLEEFCK